MKRNSLTSLLFILFGAFLLNGCHDSMTLNEKLSQVIQTYGLRPLETKALTISPKFILGQNLFFDPILSGSRDIACASCHLRRKGSSDGLPFSIGTGATGLTTERRPSSDRPQQPRNAFDLWNRDHQSVMSMFWDGRVEMKEAKQVGVFSTPIKDPPLNFLEKFENLMALQSIFPLARADEMLGIPGTFSPSSLPPGHANKPNDFANATAELDSSSRTIRVAELVMDRLLGRKVSTLEPWQESYRILFKNAYPDIPVEDLTIHHASIPISHYEELAFATRTTPWDRYLGGELEAINRKAKLGSLTFFGAGRCAVCHSGQVFSDADFHAIGVKEFGPGIGGSEIDRGRFEATGREEDLYKFRTPALRNVARTAPYFHNGSSKTLTDAIRQHIDPLRFAGSYAESGSHAMSIQQVDAISNVLLFEPLMLSSSEISELVEFLRALTSPENHDDLLIPNSVASGLSVPR